MATWLVRIAALVLGGGSGYLLGDNLGYWCLVLAPFVAFILVAGWVWAEEVINDRKARKFGYTDFDALRGMALAIQNKPSKATGKALVEFLEANQKSWGALP